MKKIVFVLFVISSSAYAEEMNFDDLQASCNMQVGQLSLWLGQAQKTILKLQKENELLNKKKSSENTEKNINQEFYKNPAEKMAKDLEKQKQSTEIK